VVVIDVTEGGPADAADVRKGDVILAVGGQPVSGLADLYAKVWALGPAGVLAPLRVRRKSETLDLTIQTIDRASRLKKRRLN
jgi:S1-C subfamily serine protease